MENVPFAGQGQRPTGFSRPGGSPNSVYIILRILGQVIVDDMADIFNMDAPRGHIGGHQDFELSFLKLLHQPESFALGKIAGNSFRRPPVALQPVGETVHPDLGVDKNERSTPIFPF